jgi:glycosyltransferase involved in cell wall biosynthesis
MRIGVDATFLAPEGRYTGMGVYTRGLARGLVRATAALQGAPEIVLLGYGPRPADTPPELGWQALPTVPAGRLGPWLSHQVVLPWMARRLGLDVLHITGINVRLSRPGVPFAAPCPLVITVHDVIPLAYYGRLGPPLPWRLQAAYRLAMLAVHRAAMIVAVSETSRRDILAHLRLRPERVRTVHNGLDFPADRHTPAETGAILARLGIAPPYLLYAGSYEPRKNLLGTVAAYRLALARRDLPPLVLLVERESGHRAAAMAQIERSGLAGRLHFLHTLPDDDLAVLYRRAALFLYPSFYEGFGFVPLQAQAAGVPVIAAGAGSLPEVLGETAVYVDPSSPEDLAAAILRVLDDPALDTSLRAGGPARASRFRWETAARRMLDIYADAALQTSPPLPQGAGVKG